MASQALARRAAAEGVTPLEYMLGVMRDPGADEKRRDAMAQAAAPYVHPKLAAIEHTGKDGEALVSMPSLTDTARAVAWLLSAGAHEMGKPK